MDEWLNELKGLIWTLAGTAMVLITLSGVTLKRGLGITLVSIALYCAAILLTRTGEKDE